MLNDYDETILREMRRVNTQKLNVVKRLKSTLEGNIKTIDELLQVRRENALLETEIAALEERKEKLQEKLAENKE